MFRASLLPSPLNLAQALESLPPFGATARKCLRALRSICAFKMILPPSYVLSSSLTVGHEPFAAGGCGDVYRGTLDRSEVCVKRMRMYSKDGADRPKKVCFRGSLLVRLG